MKTVSPELSTALAENLTYLCRLITITRTDGVIFYFTDHVDKINYEDNEYKAVNGFTATAIQNSINSTTNNIDLRFLTAATGITRDAVERGLFDDATITIDLIDYKALANGTMPMLIGLIRGARLSDRNSVTFNIFGTDIRADRPICEQYSATCRAAFGDARCKVNLALYTEAFTVDTVVSAQVFTASGLGAADVYKLGRIVWATGDNAGVMTELVTNDAGGNVFLKYRPPYPVQAGDTGNITRGCLKTVAACIGYNNLPNYRGEPYIPGNDGLQV